MDFSPILPPRKKKKSKTKRRHESIASLVSSPDEKKVTKRAGQKKKKSDKTQKQLEKFAAMTTNQNVGEGRLSLKQKSLNVELAGLFNHGKKSNLVSKYAEKERMNRARCQGNLTDLLQGPKAAHRISESEANKENIPPNSESLYNSVVKSDQDPSLSIEFSESISVPDKEQSRQISCEWTKLDGGRNLSKSALSKSFEPWQPLYNFNTNLKKISKSHSRFQFENILKTSEQNGYFTKKLDSFDTNSFNFGGENLRQPQSLFKKDNPIELNFSPDMPSFDKLNNKVGLFIVVSVSL